MRVNNKMNSVQILNNDNVNKKIQPINIHEQFINLANKTFLETPMQMKSDKKINNTRNNNIFVEQPFNHSKVETDNDLFYENFMMKLNINNYKQTKNTELFPNQTVLNSQKKHLLSKTPQLLSGKKLIPSYNNSNNNSIRSLKTSKVYSNSRNTFNSIKKNKQTSFRFTHSPYLGSVPKGTQSGKLSPRNIAKNSYFKINNNANQKVKSISFTPIDNNSPSPIKNEVLKIYAGKYNKKSNCSLIIPNNDMKFKNNSNINIKCLGNTITSSKTPTTTNKDLKLKKLNIIDNDVKIISNIITESKENKKKNTFNFCGCLVRKVP